MCMVDGSDGCENRVSNEKTRKAAKDHKCAECSRVVNKGELYRHIWGIDMDGYAFSHRICAHCMVVCEWLATNCGGYLLYGVHEDISEHVEEYNRRDLARLKIGMENDWKRLRKPGLMPIPKLPAPIAAGELRG